MNNKKVRYYINNKIYSKKTYSNILKLFNNSIKKIKIKENYIYDTNSNSINLIKKEVRCNFDKKDMPNEVLVELKKLVEKEDNKKNEEIYFPNYEYYEIKPFVFVFICNNLCKTIYFDKIFRQNKNILLNYYLKIMEDFTKYETFKDVGFISFVEEVNKIAKEEKNLKRFLEELKDYVLQFIVDLIRRIKLYELDVAYPIVISLSFKGFYSKMNLEYDNSNKIFFDINITNQDVVVENDKYQIDKRVKIQLEYGASFQ